MNMKNPAGASAGGVPVTGDKATDHPIIGTTRPLDWPPPEGGRGSFRGPANRARRRIPRDQGRKRPRSRNLR